MFTGLIAFFGGNFFRMLWGEFSAWLTAKQEHEHELERMRLQGQLDAAAFERNQQAIKLQADMGVRVIETQATSAISQIEADGWLEAVKSTGRTIGIAWVDAWNATIRPGVATWAIIMITLSEFDLFVLSSFAASVASAALGIYLADRNLAKRGK